MTRVNPDNPGACIEPGGYELRDLVIAGCCPRCGGIAQRHEWEVVEGGAINQYFHVFCEAVDCDFEDRNDYFS